MFTAFRRLECKKTDIIWMILAAALLAAGMLVWWYLPVTLSVKRDISNPYFATMDQKGNRYIINEGKSEVLKISGKGRITARIAWGDHQKDCFGEADEVAVGSDGSIYILDILWNDTGLGLSGERVLKYTSDGKFAGVVFENDYTDMMIMKRHLFSLVALKNEVRFAAVDPDGKGFSTYVLKNGQTNAKRDRYISWDLADEIQDFAVNENGGYFVIKNGTIYSFERDPLKVVYRAEDRTWLLPYNLSFRGGYLYFTDICGNGIYRLQEGKEQAECFCPMEKLQKITGLDLKHSVLETIQVTESAGKEMISVTWDNASAVLAVDQGVPVKMDTRQSFYYADSFLAKLLFCFVVWTFSGVTAIYYSMVLLRYLIHSGIFQKKRFSIFMILGVSISALVVMVSMLERFKDSYTQEQIGSMCTVTQIASDIMDTDALKHVNYPTDYGSEDYRKLQECMNDLIDVTSRYSENLYCNIVKVNGERAYALAYLDHSIGAYYPLDEGEAKEAKRVYRTGEQYINDGKQDATGSYVYVKAPVKDRAGRVIGIIEIGMVSDTLSGMIDSMRTRIMVEIILMVIIAVFLLNEGLAFMEDRRDWKRLSHKERTHTFPIPYLRVVTFFVFAAYNMPTSFLPVYVERFYREDFPITRELAGSLPLTVNFAMIGVMSLFVSGLLRRFGFRLVMGAGALCCAVGDLMMAYSGSYGMILAGLILGGMGCGLLMNGLSIIVADQSDQVQSKGFSVINGAILSGMISGTVIGAAIAEKLGESKMFFCSAVIWGSMLFLLLAVGGLFHMSGKERVRHTGRLSFVFSGQVLGYLLLIVVPYVIINGFTSYFLPIFADGQGLGESQTSLLLVMNCLVGIFLSEALTGLTMKHLGRGTLYLSSAVSLGVVLLFGYFQTLPMLALTLFLLGAAKSFGAAGREILFCRQPKVAAYGEDEAMGYYNLADNLGESIGTMVFGGMLSVGLVTGMWIFAGISAAAMGIYGWLQRGNTV